jgi:hypothetical protein
MGVDDRGPIADVISSSKRLGAGSTWGNSVRAGRLSIEPTI